jgi:hypothetical protein
MKLEYAREHEERPLATAMLRAVYDLKRLQPPCWRQVSHGRVSTVLRIDGVPHAVCGACARAIKLDDEIARQRETYRRMTRR